MSKKSMKTRVTKTIRISVAHHSGQVSMAIATLKRHPGSMGGPFVLIILPSIREVWRIAMSIRITAIHTGVMTPI